MKITIIGATQSLLPNTDGRTDTPFEFCAKTMATCESTDPIAKMTTESLEATQKRVASTLKYRHHSGYDMFNVVFEFDGVSKIFCMFLNNLHTYATEETSGRHTKLVLPAKEKAEFDYFYNRIRKHTIAKYPDLKPYKIEQIALENARYLTSVGAKTNMTHSMSLRHFNYVYGWAKKFLTQKDYNIYEKLAIPDFEQFCAQAEHLTIDGQPILDEGLNDVVYNRSFNLFGDISKSKEHFGTNYEVTYPASASAIAQIQRNRSTNITLSVPNKTAYYTPAIIHEIAGLEDEWNDSLKNLDNLPQARLLDVRETAEVNAFIMKVKERFCPLAQEEIRGLTYQTFDKIVNGLKSYDLDYANFLENNYGGKYRREFNDFKCVCRKPCVGQKPEIELGK